MSVSGPSVIVNPTPATGLRIGRPVSQVWIDGIQLLNWFDLTSTRGLDQPMATADITVPHPLADSVKFWSKVQIVAGVPPANHAIGQVGLVTRFTGYVRGLNNTLYPPGKVIHCEDILSVAANKFTHEEMDLGSFLDSQAVREVLHGCGYHESTFQSINGLTSGTGAFLVDVEEAQLFWELGETGLEKIQDIDSISLGWRVYATAGGLITRKQIIIDPNKVNHVWHFAEGVDILEGSTEVVQEDPKNEITVTGFDGNAVVTLDPEDDPFDWNRNTYWIRFQQLRTQAISSGIINPTDVALFILAQISKPIIRITFTTHLDIHFQGQEVIKVTSEKLEVAQNFWVQSVQFSCLPDGSWSQTITGISHLQPYNRHMVVPPIDTTPAEGVEPGDDVEYPELPDPGEESPEDFLIDFTIEAIDKELGGDPAVPTDTGGSRYVVVATDTSTNTGLLTYTREWTAAGAGLVGPATGGTEPSTGSFTTFFNDISDATITLTLNPGEANEASLTLPVSQFTTPVRSRKLYALTPTTCEAFNGTDWVQHTPTGKGEVTVVGGGPYWGTSEGWFLYSADDLVTPPTEYDVTNDGEITAIWVHETQAGHVVIGTSAGTLYVTTDHGVTWGGVGGGSAGGGKFGPDGGNPDGSVPIRQVITSINNVNEWHVLTPTGWYRTPDAGASWVQVRAGNFVYLELSHSRNIIVTTGGQLQKAEDGTPFTFADGYGAGGPLVPPNPSPVGPGPATPEEEACEAQIQNLFASREELGGALIPYWTSCEAYLTARYGASTAPVFDLEYEVLEMAEEWYADMRAEAATGGDPTPYPAEISDYLTYRFGAYDTVEGGGHYIVAATSHIRADAFYAIAADGSTWYSEADGSFNLVAGAPIPEGEVLPGGAYRDGQVIDVVYFAAQDGGIFKTADGFKTAGGYMRLRNADQALLTP